MDPMGRLKMNNNQKKKLGNHGPFPCFFRVSGLDSFKQLLRVGSSGPLKPLSSLWSVRPVRIAGLAEGFIAASVAQQAPKKPFTAVRVRGRSYTKIIKNPHTNSVSLVRHIIFLWWHTIQKFKNRCHLHPFTNQTLCPTKACVTQMFHNSSSEQCSTPSGIPLNTACIKNDTPIVTRIPLVSTAWRAPTNLRHCHLLTTRTGEIRCASIT